MKIIDLLNKIANGEEVPKRIRINHWCYKFEWIEHQSNYYDKHNEIDLMSCLSCDKEELNYEVHEIEEEKKIIPTDFENLGYALGSIQKYINKGYDKAIEEKKIPEKMEEIENGDFLEIPSNHDIMNKINEIIDYLKSKGE